MHSVRPRKEACAGPGGVSSAPLFAHRGGAPGLPKAPTCQSALDNFIVNAGTELSATISGITVQYSYYAHFHERSWPDTTFTYRCLSGENIEHFRALVLGTDWSSLYNKKDASEAYDEFLSTFSRISTCLFRLKQER